MKYRNNPFNIRTGQKWVGVIGSKNGFCEFDNIEHCIRAAALLLMQSYRKKGCISISSIIRRFAPPVENNTEAYIRFVCSRMGECYLPDTRMEVKLDYACLLSAMAQFESNTKIGSVYILYIIVKFNISVYCLTSKK